MMYYGPAHMSPEFETEPVLKHLDTYGIFDNVEHKLPGLKSRTQELATRWELEKIHFACEGMNCYSAQSEGERLETGRVHLWDHDLKNSPLSLAARYQSPSVPCKWGFGSGD